MRLFIGITIIAVLLGCEKETNIGSELVTVRVDFYQYNSSVSNPEGLELKLSITGEDSYLYKKKTDVDGEVIFSLLREGVSYTVDISYEKDGIPYSGSVVFDGGVSEDQVLELKAKVDDFNITSI